MKFLYFTDTHIRGTTPKNRKDDFIETLENKFNEILKIIEMENIDYLLHGGDLFDRPDISISIVSRFAKIFNNICIPFYIISGNHDVFGHNPNTINRTMIGLLNELGILEIINNKNIMLEKNDIRVQLTGQPYIYDIDKKDKSSYIVSELDNNIDFSIHMVHGMLLDKPFIKGVDYTLIDEIKNTLADITLSGHYHSGFKEINIEGKYFINPGSVIRISNTMREFKRKPKVVIIDIEDKIDISYIYLESAKDGELVLDRSEIEKNIFKNERIYEFKQTIDAAMNFEKMDINDILIEVSKAEEIEEKVKKEALKRIADIQMKGINGD